MKKYNLNHIKSKHYYTIKEISKTLKVHIRTVHSESGKILIMSKFQQGENDEEKNNSEDTIQLMKNFKGHSMFYQTHIDKNRTY